MSSQPHPDGGLSLINDFSNSKYRLEEKILHKRVKTLRKEYDNIAEAK